MNIIPPITINNTFFSIYNVIKLFLKSLHNEELEDIMKTGFVILNYNSYDLTRKIVETVSNYDLIDLIVIVDNNSTDKSFDKLKDLQNENVKVCNTYFNGGYSYGNNIGAKICAQNNIDIMFICNPDVEIEKKDINIIINAFNKYDYSLLSGVEYDINGNISKPEIWHLMDYKDDILDCFFLGRRYSKKKKNVKLNTHELIQKVDMVKGSFFAVKLKDFMEVGMFDESVFLFCEERILAKKFEIYKKKIGIVTKAKYFHNHSTIINKIHKAKYKQIKILYKSRYYYNKKYNKKGKVSLLLLKLAMLISLFEYQLHEMIFEK